MNGKRALVAALMIAILLSLAAGCAGGVRVGDLQTETQTVELDDTASVEVEIQTGAADLEISGGASELLEASFVYNVEELDPRATYSNGRLEIFESDVNEGIRSLFDIDEYRNEWDLKFNEEVPMEMTISLGAGPAYLTLGALALTDLRIDGGAGQIELDLSGSQTLEQLDLSIGAGSVVVDLTGEWLNDLDARIEGGLGEIRLRLPDGVGVMVEVDTGIGSVNAGGLIKDGNRYTNEAYGQSDVDLRIDIGAGVGQIFLDVE